MVKGGVYRIVLELVLLDFHSPSAYRRFTNSILQPYTTITNLFTPTPNTIPLRSTPASVKDMPWNQLVTPSVRRDKALGLGLGLGGGECGGGCSEVKWWCSGVGVKGREGERGRGREPKNRSEKS
jgi:hypothetical protein